MWILQAVTGAVLMEEWRAGGDEGTAEPVEVCLRLHSHFLHSSVLDSSILGHGIECAPLWGKTKGIPESVRLAETRKHADQSVTTLINCRQECVQAFHAQVGVGFRMVGGLWETMVASGLRVPGSTLVLLDLLGEIVICVHQAECRGDLL